MALIQTVSAEDATETDITDEQLVERKDDPSSALLKGKTQSDAALCSQEYHNT